jgi:hypothetical protein
MSQNFNYNHDYYKHRLQQLEEENRQLRTENDSLRDENTSLRKEKDSFAQKVRELESENTELRATLQEYASSKLPRKPEFPLNYSPDRNKPDSSSSSKGSRRKGKRKRKRSKNARRPGRIPNKDKPALADREISLYPKGVPHKKCKLRYEQFVWHYLNNKAEYIHYKIYAVPVRTMFPKFPAFVTGVANMVSNFC